MELENSKDYAKIYVARNFIEKGVCEYNDERVYLDESTLCKSMCSMKGRPVVIDHIRGLTPENMQEHAVGYVVEASCNPMNSSSLDCKFVIFDEEAKKLINDGYSVSCAYIPTEFGQGGTWHNVPYDRQITNLEFTHLALVANPRYEDAKIYENAKDKDFITVGEGEDRRVIPTDYLDSNKGDKRSFQPMLQKFLSNLKYGHLDVSKYDDTGYRYEIDVTSLSDKTREWLLNKVENFTKVEYAKKKYYHNPNGVFIQVRFEGMKKDGEMTNKKEQKGRWITVKGTHIFIKDGQSVEDAIDKKFKGTEADEAKKDVQLHDQISKEYKKREKMTKDLEGKYMRDDVEFDEDQALKDIKDAMYLGYEKVEDIAEFLGLDEDEVLTITSSDYPDDGVLRLDDEKQNKKEDNMEIQEFFNKMGEMIEEKLNACKGKMNEGDDVEDEDDDDKFEMDGEVYSKKELVNAFKEKKCAEEEAMKKKEEEEKQNAKEQEQNEEFFNNMEKRIVQMNDESDKIEVYTQSKGLERGKQIYG